MAENSHSIFISYASPDRERVLPYFNWLEKQGFNVWIDCRRLKAGQNWDFEIKRALDKATFVLMFVSNLSYDRRGYLQRELKLALDKLSEKLIDDIYIIPVLLDDDVQIPELLKGIQCILASNSQCREQIADALQHQLERLGIERKEIQEKEEVYWTSEIKREEFDGIPGYEVELQFLTFRSDKYSSLSEIGEFIKGDFLRSLFQHREEKLSPMPDSFNYGQDKYRRTNTYDAHCEEPVIVEKIISIQYSVGWYGAGAAHPNYHFQTYSFLLEPLILIESLESIFNDSEVAFNVIQTEVRKQLCAIRLNDGDSYEDVELPPETINDGTKEWSDFSSFVFQSDGIEFLFAPYQVAAYALGSHSAKIPYESIVKLMKNEYVSNLGIEYLLYR